MLCDRFSLTFLDPDTFSELQDSHPSNLDWSTGTSAVLSSVGFCFMLCVSPFSSFSFSLRLSLMIILSRIPPLISDFSNFFSLFIWMLSKSSDLEELDLSFIFLCSKLIVSGGGFSRTPVPCKPCDVEASLKPHVILDL